ncbi:MAG: hypothetical protein LBF22_09130 [Deltaproteobacteria bacterium]|nr:hypothetical protein [Deltaproteobacteria bacterium]
MRISETRAKSEQIFILLKLFTSQGHPWGDQPELLAFYSWLESRLFLRENPSFSWVWKAA